MRNARAKVTGRVHSITGRAAERKAERPDEDTDDVRPKAVSSTVEAREAIRELRGEDHPDNEHEEERSDELAEECRAHLADGRRRAEDAELRGRIFRLFPMREISEPDDGSAEDAAEHLHDGRHDELRERVDADEHLRERDRRVEVALRSAERRRREDAERDGETPSDGNVDPARTLAFRFFQRQVSADAAAEDEQHHRADELAQQVFGTVDHLNFLLRNSYKRTLRIVN